jgi:hypothetical protein
MPFAQAAAFGQDFGNDSRAARILTECCLYKTGTPASAVSTKVESGFVSENALIQIVRPLSDGKPPGRGAPNQMNLAAPPPGHFS